MSVQQIFYWIRDRLYYSKLGNKIIILIKASGLYWGLSRYYSRKRSLLMFKNPTPEMISSLKFFNDNMDRARDITSWLEDEQSKKSYQKMIAFRCSYNVYEFPFCDCNSKYYLNDFIDYQQNEVLIDCGAFVGDGYYNFTKALKKNNNGNYKKIVAFEPDPNNVNVLRKLKIPHLIIINAGVSDEDSVMYFKSDLSSSHFVSGRHDGNSYSEIPIKAIDNCIDCDDATFIKMDVEGYELNALIGAKKVISKNRPKLAICIYHSDKDMLRIAEWIRNLDLNYKLYVRQHAFFYSTETVLYAIPR